ncbi:MAG TPA: hypothetical protein PL072_00275 [Phycisphaerales bacterium]|nr:hypothetical protein [Phycisphaerales bacterium]
MTRFMSRSDPNASFLPEDYLRRKSELRAIVVSFILFCIVILGIVGAFFVTNRQATVVKARNEALSREYAVESAKIDELKKLEAQKQEMMEKAEITTALIEKAPRSILLAELINRMPKELTLSELNLRSRRLDAKPSKLDKGPGSPGAAAGAGKAPPKTRSLASNKSPKNAPKEEPKPPKPMPPRYDFRLEIMGLAATDQEIADYHTALKQCPLLENVELVYSGDVKLDDLMMRKFRIEAGIRSDVDARNIEPLHVPRLPPRPSLAKLPGELEVGGDADNLDPTIPNSPVFTNAENQKGKKE